jgi:hypothetical protein
MGDISRNFSYDEFKVSKSFPQVAKAIELTELDRYKFFWLTHLFLQPIRDAIPSHILRVSSALRRGELNGLVGGVPTSDHNYKYFSAAVDFLIGDYNKRDTGDYLEQILRICKRKRAYVKQFIYYYPFYDSHGNKHGDFIHLSLRDKTSRVWEVLFCAKREGRHYFPSKQEAEDYMRAGDG